ncbi:DUF1254 domain-containing protein [Pseudomonas sp. PDM16]|uniref:DUF1254 domain-containing protein n=1 Tax=Pseudomonas sp. PDM16 TaxID=2769292 RepID=UPI0017876B59|nr:DUF1254 domain-containing protein [Pseudomonas sp. PDM16]MBD9415954.1 DUF1254 domain-containing protein [Pseudomonas sp. PDM16]
MPLSKKQRWGLGIGAGALLAAGLCGYSVIQQARETAQAYLFGYPLVMMEVTKQHQMLIGTSAMNRFNHAKRFPDPGFNGVVSPNIDTLYSISHFDLRHEPLVMEIPDTSGRFYMLQIMDAWSNVVISPGTRTIGTAPKRYLVAGPDWHGETPAGLELVRVPTQLAWLIGRIRSANEHDYQAVTQLQEHFKLMPLSSWQGQPTGPATPVAMVELPRLALSPSPDRQVATWSQDEFFATFCRLLKDNPPASADAPMMQRIQATGLLGEGCTAQLSPLQKFGSSLGYRKVQEALANARQLLEELPTYNGWRIGYDLGEYGTRYEQRAVVAKIALGANLAADAIYPNLWKDQDGQPLSGEHRYVLHFSKEQLPPVRAFWSLTLYNGQQFLSANPLNRYALSDGSDLHYNADGSLDLYVQHEQPQTPEQLSNWLPAPTDDFSLFLRLYWPEDSVLNKQWLPPAIKRLP